MPRVKRAVIAKKKHKKLRARARGRRLLNRTTIKRARQMDLKSGVKAYADRKVKKRTMRALWNIRINAGLRPLGLTYSRFINLLKKANVEIDRKVLSQLAKDHPEIFAKVVEKVS
ncbi:50S ribosomal protein L20 [Candidatus Microgenomates bacterium]|nr:50S ribosomal protein L20 [Candidatus Microgenomates bacterium]